MSKLSKTSKSIHKKWQKEAEAKGGKGAKIVLGQNEAKKLISDLLHESFRPINITSIYEALKAVVPSPLLKSSLDSMSISPTDNGSKDGGGDSEDDDFVKTTKKSSSKSAETDSFAGALLRKVGRNANTTLYYANQSKLPNDGNGLIPDDRNELISSMEKSKEERKELSKTTQSIDGKVSALLSEPLNEEMKKLLPLEESAVEELSNKVEAARKLKVNETRVKSTKRKVEKMATYWRKRKRLCIDFLNMMDENTEGVVTAKKCLSGNGQIDIESDEVAVKQAKQFHENRKKRQHIKKSKIIIEDEPKASESFIAVKQASNGTIERIYLDE